MEVICDGETVSHDRKLYRCVTSGLREGHLERREKYIVEEERDEERIKTVRDEERAQHHLI